VFVPVYDDNRTSSIRFQYVTMALIVVNFVVFGLEVSGMQAQVIASFGIVPGRLLNGPLLGGIATMPGETLMLPPWATVFTYMFFHADIWHIGTNMLFLWVFGDNVEDAMGHVRFLGFYIACGVAAGLVHALMQPSSPVALLGASGAVAGVIAAYVMLYPRVKVWVLVFRIIPLNITAAWAIGAWVATQIVMVLLPQSGPATAVAGWAHIGGLAAGAVLVVILRRRGVPLFG
jgi:membrane associated rhomboid family serine protease